MPMTQGQLQFEINKHRKIIDRLEEQLMELKREEQQEQENTELE